MNVIICRGDNDRIEVQFYNWKENRSRYARIELDILKAITFMGVDPTRGDGEMVFLSRQHPWDNFTQEDVDKIIKVLHGYMIEPEVRL